MLCFILLQLYNSIVGKNNSFPVLRTVTTRVKIYYTYVLYILYDMCYILA